ncbi:WD repeat-containing protein 53 [Actinomortierella ambigua]|uniref:WD repeat-containing protein 53 n=1 Tax=Actinomortierella ambigua TaxID=1343610 RepID=A0A9P6Q402_9FUNG|nr:WD repeat-containing protein 53 [Actinomortierella ambigua]
MQPSWFLNGHRAPVLCLNQSKDGLKLATGSEDKTCRIWDLSTNQSSKAIVGFDDAVTAVCWDPLDNQKIYVASGLTLYVFSLATETVILNVEKASGIYTGAEDEMNQISVNDRGTFLAVCDDAGNVRALDLKSGQWMRRLAGGHDNNFSCDLLVRFRCFSSLDIAYLFATAISGGMDYRILSWDFYKNRSTEILKTDDMKALNAPQGSAQVFNPPFVLSVAIHPSGTRAAVGLGDGTVQFLHKPNDVPLSPEALKDYQQQQHRQPPASDAKGKKGAKAKGKGSADAAWIVGGRLLDAHFSSLTTVEYLSQAGLLVSAANNGTIAVWDEQEARSATLSTNPTAVLLSEEEEEEQRGAAGEGDASLQRQQQHITLRAVKPLFEFRTLAIFDRINGVSCRTVVESDEGGNKVTRVQLFIAGVPQVAEGENAPQPSPQVLGRIAVYEVSL